MAIYGNTICFKHSLVAFRSRSKSLTSSGYQVNPSNPKKSKNLSQWL